MKITNRTKTGSCLAPYMVEYVQPVVNLYIVRANWRSGVVGLGFKFVGVNCKLSLISFKIWSKVCCSNCIFPLKSSSVELVYASFHHNLHVSWCLSLIHGFLGLIFAETAPAIRILANIVDSSISSKETNLCLNIASSSTSASHRFFSCFEER